MPDWVNQYETEFQSDCSRLIYSPSFRRLQGKTQLYPNGEYDYFRSRLTHSLEVNEIAQCIGARINQQILKKRGMDARLLVSPDVLRFACLAHDLGHPPFGHDGERQLDECMEEAGGFDGNAQTFRILTKLEKGCINSVNDSRKDGDRTGLNITFRSLASVLKHYNNEKDSPKNGYYSSEADIVGTIFQELGHPDSKKKMLTMECQIMDIADDISNAVHDLDDSLKGNLLNPFDLFMPQEDILEKVAIDVFHQKEGKNFHYKDADQRTKDFKKIYRQLNWIFNESGFIDFSLPRGKDILDAISPIYKKMRSLMSDGSKRSLFISNLKNKFVNSLAVKYNKKAPLFSKIIYLKGSQEDDDPRLQVAILKSFHHFYQCHSFYIEARAFRGHYIVKQLFDAVRSDTRLMPDDYYAWLTAYGPDNEKKKKFKPEQLRCICDFIAGMTDRYCLEFYGRLFSENPQSIFKPL